MRRHWIIVAHIAAAVGLLIAIAVAVLWARSYGRQETFGYSHADPPGPTATDWGYHVESRRGRLSLTRIVDHVTDPAVVALQRRESYPSRWFWYDYRIGGPPDRWVAFDAVHNEYPYGTDYGWTATVPHAVPVLIFAAPAVMLMAGHRAARRRVRAGRCLTCGYDLRATTGRCPECGTVVAASTPI